MADDRDYILAGTAAEAESARLALLEECHDAGTLRRLEHLGVATGWRCLEVGAGRGSIARWLSTQVGPDGHVVAADIDCRFLTEMPDNVEVRTVDIRQDEIETDHYDLVHCRALLMHLRDPVAMLRKLSSALRPGGVLLAEEGDYGMLAYGGHPDADSCTETIHRVFTKLDAAGVQNSYLGRTLPGLVVDAGLELLGGEVAASVARPGDPAFTFHQATIEAGGAAAVAAGFSTEAEHAMLVATGRSPSTVLTSVALAAAWARRAVRS